MIDVRRANTFHKLSAFALTVLALVLAGMVPAQAQSFGIVYVLGSQGADPEFPTGPLVQGQDGGLYGGARASTILGFPDQVFKIAPGGALSLLATFSTADEDTCGNGLTLGLDGNYYGVCQFGDSNFLGYGYSITPAGVVTALHNFTGVSPEGSQPQFPPVQGSDGNFYGTTMAGGVDTYGTVYKMTPTGTVTTLHGFTRFGTDGATPTTGLVLGNDGNFYGATVQNFYKITPKGKLTNLHTLNNTSDGSNPVNLILGLDGNFYGTSLSGGTNNLGTFYKMTASGKYTVVHNFSSADGPRGSFDYLMQATDGNFYGAQVYGFGGDFGSLYKITTKGVDTLLFSFDGTDGSLPRGGMFQATDGRMYGDTQQGGGTNYAGVIYNLNANLAPFVRVQTNVGKVGTSVNILGQGFTSATKVSFNGTSAVFAAVSDNFMTATIPTGATTGYVTVIEPTGTLKSSQKFKVKP